MPTWNGVCRGQSSFPADRIGRINGISYPGVVRTRQKLAEEISSVRDRIVHQGEFIDEERSVIAIEKARMFIQQLVSVYGGLSFRPQNVYVFPPTHEPCVFEENMRDVKRSSHYFRSVLMGTGCL